MLEAPAADAELVALGERANVRRSHLLVSTVLGKHVPVAAARCRAAGIALGLAAAGDARAGAGLRALQSPETGDAARLVADVAARPAQGGAAAVVVGFSETATGLAEQVAAALDAAWLQTTTRHEDARGRGLEFAETHSHAPEQLIVPPAGGWPDGRVVIVDDELTSGATVARLIGVMHGVSPRPAYTVAVLVDARPAGPSALDRAAAELGVTIDVVALQRRAPVPPAGGGWSGGALPPRSPRRAADGLRDVTLVREEPAERDGLDRDARASLAARARAAAQQCGELPAGSLVLGCGEHMALAQLAALAGGATTLTSSTSRSPALVADRPGYPLRDGLAFPNPEAPDVPGYAYNVRAAERPVVVVHFAEPAHRTRGAALLDALAAAGAEQVVAVTCAGRA